MKASQRAKWERTRAMGFWRFVLLYWVLLFGGFMIVVTSVFDYFSGPYGPGFERLKTRVPIWLIAGFVTGVIVWCYAEYQYKRGSGNASL